ncbi:hypothetical protein [uncultured Shimia sp.]|uniref:hypothetical protein n=1 Tax=uncultured Shimia sp. TaxID=573152 RepID=UPI00261C8806|nr:hypothetical protein [uncultured Shimia sp.]
MPIADANGKLMAAFSIWDVGDLDMLAVLKSHLGALKDTASDIPHNLCQTS